MAPNRLLANVGGRYAVRVCLLLTVWVVLVIAAFQLRTYPIAGDLPHLNGRLLLQQRALDPLALTRHLDPTTEPSSHLEPDVDRSPSLSEDMLVEDAQRRNPNLPISYWNANKNKPLMLNKTCARFPSIFDLEFNNLYWQTLKSRNGTFQLFAAYLDNRPQNRLGPTIRVLGMIDRIEPSLPTYCQIWFDGRSKPVVVKYFEYKYIWYKKWGNYKQGIYQPYLVACPIPGEFRQLRPMAISLVEHPCDNATNSLRVIYDKPPEKKDFAVCVKGLDFLHEDLSVRLVEWIELLGMLGADKVFFYELQVHPNISKVLRHYEATGQASVTPISLAGGQPNVPSFQHLYLTKRTNNKRQNELIPYNDCFYRNMYKYKYMVLIDIDEVIMPLKSANWKELVEQHVLPNIRDKASYNVRNVYFLDDLLHAHGWFKGIPKYMHMLQHVYRAKNFTKPNQYVKCFHNTERVLTLHNHFPLSCLGGPCSSYPIPTDVAQLQHYRADCVKTLKNSCKDFKEHSVMDTAIWRHRDELVRRTTATLRHLGFFAGDIGRRKRKR